MSKTDFAKLIIKKMQNAIGSEGKNLSEDVADKAMTAFAEGVTEYIVDKTQVVIAYKGILPTTPPSPDPVVVDVFKVTGECPALSPTESFSAWLLEIQNKIIAGFALESKGEAGIVFAQTPFLKPTIKADDVQSVIAKTVGGEDSQLKSMEAICGAIMDWINQDAMNTAEGPATNSNSGSAGTANITKITIS